MFNISVDMFCIYSSVSSVPSLLVVIGKRNGTAPSLARFVKKLLRIVCRGLRSVVVHRYINSGYRKIRFTSLLCEISIGYNNNSNGYSAFCGSIE